MPSSVLLRDVIADDLSLFFAHQQDPLANEMAAFPARARDAFMAHWTQVLSDERIIKKTILFDGQVAGNIVSFEQFGERLVGYWIGRQYWGNGIATRALKAFLEYVTERPLYAHVASHNIASQRVLEKCGFTRFGEEISFCGAHGETLKEFVLRLEA